MGAMEGSLRVLLYLCAYAVSAGAISSNRVQCSEPDSSGISFHNFSMYDVYEQEEIDFHQYEGHVVLLVNTASF